jgi:hypothetical protein
MAQAHTELSQVRGDNWRTCCCGFYCAADDYAYWHAHLVATVALPHNACITQENQTTPSCGWKAGEKVCGEQKELSKQVSDGPGSTSIPVCNKHILEAWRIYSDPVVKPL